MNDKSKLETWAAPFLLTLTALIYVGSAGLPALLDDADSFYAEVAREMNLRHDWITPYANELRFLEKPPLFYWLIALSYKVCGAVNAFTARLPTALAVTALVFVTYKIGKLLFGTRAGFFGGLALATSIGLFLFTRIILPDALFTLLLALILYAFLRWQEAEPKDRAVLWLYGLAGLAVLARGLVGLVFPAAIIFLTLVVSGKVKEVVRLLSIKGLLLFLVIAVPWHIVIGERNPGFYWFYFINEHVLRFLGKRYPMDYGTVPLLPFWALHLVWLFPSSIYLLTLLRPKNFQRALAEHRPAMIFLLVWALTILLFFSFSTRLEYYTMPALPALALLAGKQCACFWERGGKWPGVILASIGVLTGIACVAIAVFVSSGNPSSFMGLKDNPDIYAYYLGHLFDLTPESLRALRTPLLLAGLGFGILLPLHGLAKSPERKAMILAMAMLVFFVAADFGFVIFAPRLTSKPLAEALIPRLQSNSMIIIDGEYEEGSSVAFYTGRTVYLHSAPSSNLYYGSRYGDAPPLFLDDERLQQMWRATDRRVFLVTYQAKKERLATLLPQTKFTIAEYGDKILLSNFADQSMATVSAALLNPQN
ncbi:MAG: glycosyltransferase family 39 protein [Acidobacteria bacterium]|nr:glycosyltransferase family 39 protein [Acidobacteriota bacterium]